MVGCSLLATNEQAFLTVGILEILILFDCRLSAKLMVLTGYCPSRVEISVDIRLNVNRGCKSSPFCPPLTMKLIILC